MLVEQVHELVVVHFVEKQLQIDVHHILFALLDQLLRRADRPVCDPLRSASGSSPPHWAEFIFPATNLLSC